MKKLIIIVMSLFLLNTLTACGSKEEKAKPKEPPKEEKLKEGIHFVDTDNEETKESFKNESLTVFAENKITEWLKQDGRNFEIIRKGIIKDEDLTLINYKLKKYLYEINLTYDADALQTITFWYDKNDNKTKNLINIILNSPELDFTKEDLDKINMLVNEGKQNEYQSSHYLVELIVNNTYSGISIMKQDGSASETPFTPTGDPGTGITMELFNRIIEGMSYNQVRSMIGTEGILQASASQNGSTAKTYLWNSSNHGAATMIFVDGILTTKGQAGL